MTGPTADQPLLLIIAGPNGPGKSTAYQESIVELGGRSFRIINPDLFAARIREVENLDQDEANLEAVRRIEDWLETSILAGHTIGVETVLSTGKYRRLVEKAKAVGYLVQLIYVILETPQLNVERVRLRVQRGGHSVPEDKIVKRYHASLEQLPWFLAQADWALLFDNSGASHRIIGEKKDGVITLDAGAPPLVLSAVETIRSD